MILVVHLKYIVIHYHTGYEISNGYHNFPELLYTLLSFQDIPLYLLMRSRKFILSHNSPSVSSFMILISAYISHCAYISVGSDSPMSFLGIITPVSNTLDINRLVSGA